MAVNSLQGSTDPISRAIVDAKGDLIVGISENAVDRLAIGPTNGHVLQIDSSTATGLKWASVSILPDDDQIILASQVFG